MSVVSRGCFAYLLLSLFFMALAKAGPVYSQNASSHLTELTLKEALARTLKNSPQLAIFPLQLREAEALQLQAELRPAIEINAEVENVLGSGDYRRGDMAEYTLGLSQTIELGDKREQRIAVAEINRKNIVQNYELARLDILAETARRFIEAVHAQELVTFSEKQLRSAQENVSVSQIRIQEGAVSNSDLSRIKISALQSKLAFDRAKAEFSSSKSKLAASWGSNVSDFAKLDANVQKFPPLPNFNYVESFLKTNPQLTQLLNEERLREAQVRLAESGAATDLKFGAGIRRFAESDDRAMVFSFSMPLFSASRNRGAVSEARAKREIVTAKRQLADIEIHTLFLQLWQQLLTQQQEAIRLQTEVLPLATEVLKDIQYGYREGRYSAIDLLNARNESREIERSAIDAAAAVHLQLLEIERLTGQPMTEASRFSTNNKDYLP